ncbi:PGF-CTERM sorting domain-containing protein, partial [Halovivax sp.]|uniref:PGF-CTERM sorting domain-containing protein n=1 Tax=Halovivax sp. TaxID=1935978 RepID=UPI0025C3B473
IENPLDDDPRRIALEFEDGEALATFELLDEDETADLDLEEYAELEAWDIDDPSVNDTYSVEIVASRLASFEVQPVDEPIVQGEPLELEFVNATDIDGEPYTTGDDSLTNIDIENPLDDDPRRVALEFEDGEARSTFELLDEDETEDLSLGEVSGLEAWDIDDSSVNDTYSVDIVASRLASFKVQPIDDPVVQGEPLELEVVNATDIDGEPYTTGDDSMTNIDIENPLDDDPRRVALEFEDGEALTTFELLDGDETDTLETEEFSKLEAWDIDDPSVNDTYSVEIVAESSPSLPPAPSPSADISVTNVTIDTERVDVGDTVSLDIVLTNEGDGDGSETVMVRLDGEELASTSVDLEGGETTTVDVEVDPGDLETGVYELQLVDEDSTVLSVVDFEVENGESDDDEPSGDEADDEENDEAAGNEADDDEDDGVADDEADGDEIPGFGVVLAVVAILGLCVLGARKPSA